MVWCNDGNDDGGNGYDDVRSERRDILMMMDYKYL